MYDDSTPESQKALTFPLDVLGGVGVEEELGKSILAIGDFHGGTDVPVEFVAQSLGDDFLRQELSIELLQAVGGCLGPQIGLPVNHQDLLI